MIVGPAPHPGPLRRWGTPRGSRFHEEAVVPRIQAAGESQNKS